MIYSQRAVNVSVTLVTAKKQMRARTRVRVGFEVLTICFAAFILSLGKGFR